MSPILNNLDRKIELVFFQAGKEEEDSKEFRTFQCQVFYASLNQILQAFKPYMEKPDIVCYADGYFCWTIYGLGAYIADYPEQVLLACIVQNWCPW